MQIATPDPNSGTIDSGTIIVYGAILFILGIVLGVAVLTPMRPNR